MAPQLIRRITITAALFLTLLSGCSQHVSEPFGGTGLEPPDDFDYSNNTVLTIVFRAMGPDGTPLNQIRCKVYRTRQDRENNTSPQMSGFTRSNGELSTTLPIPNVQDSVFLKFDYIGAINEADASSGAGSILFVLGQGINGKRSFSHHNTRKHNFAKSSSTSLELKLLGSYNSSGKPNYLEAIPDTLTTAELDTINQILPQGAGLPTAYPEYFTGAAKTGVTITTQTPVYVTFVASNSSYSNVLAFYTYPSNAPPTNDSDIDTLTVVFPHASYSSGLNTGDKVLLGTFNAGTTIGWVVLTDGWDGDEPLLVNDRYYSAKNLNNDAGPDHQHFVSLTPATGLSKLPNLDRFLVTLEDRELLPNKSTYDYNDLTFYVSGNTGSFDKTDVVEYPVESDCDGDGVPDASDDFPCDPDRATQVVWDNETLVFDDDWPVFGDMDYNDAIIDTRYTIVLDATNQIADITGRFILRAMGSGKSNGFGFSIPVPPAQVDIVTGYQLNAGLITLAANGTEAGQSETTIIVFDNGLNLITAPAEGIGVNTERGYTYINPDTITVSIHFVTRPTTAQAGWPPYNPFLIIDQDRTREVHLRNNTPTDLANSSLFGSDDDDSNPGLSQYYQTTNNLVWAMNIPGIWHGIVNTTFEYPFEADSVATAYNWFTNWVNSGGVTNIDWYYDDPGYQDEGKIYKPFGIGKRR